MLNKAQKSFSKILLQELSTFLHISNLISCSSSTCETLSTHGNSYCVHKAKHTTMEVSEMLKFVSLVLLFFPLLSLEQHILQYALWEKANLFKICQNPKDYILNIIWKLYSYMQTCTMEKIKNVTLNLSSWARVAVSIRWFSQTIGDSGQSWKDLWGGLRRQWHFF